MNIKRTDKLVRRSLLTLALLFVPPGFATKPRLPLPTLEEKVRASTFIVLGEVGRVHYVTLSGPSTYKLVDYVPQDFAGGHQPVLSIRVLKALKWIGESPVPKELKLFHSEQSGTRAEYRQRYSPGTHWIIFLRPSEGWLKSEPPEFFGEAPIFRVPHLRGVLQPEPSHRLEEVTQLLSAHGTM